MTEIHLMTAEHAYWKETIAFAERCSWKAGFFLAGKMQENDFQEWERVCAVCVNGKVAGFSTFTERDELSEQYDFTPFSSAHAIITRRGKNWYVTVDDIVITVNAHSCTIITAHRKKG